MMHSLFGEQCPCERCERDRFETRVTVLGLIGCGLLIALAYLVVFR